MTPRATALVLMIGAGCRSGGTDPARDLTTIEGSVEAICACTDLTCVDAASADWDKLPWPALPTADQPTFERSVALEDRGNRCQLRYRAKQDLDQFAQWAERMCACTDAACASAVDDEAVAWIKRMDSEPVSDRILQVAHDSIVKLEGCHATLAGTAAVAPVPLPDTNAERIGATADRICACSTMACADLLDRELVEWTGTRYRGPRLGPTTGMVLSGPAKQANATYQRCHGEKSVKWPHRSRLLQRYGIDP